MLRSLYSLFYIILLNQALGQVTTPSRESTQRQIIKSPEQAIREGRKLTPTREAELFYKAETQDRPCSHCPEYVKLIREVNKIVEKVPQTSVARQNESLIQLNRLKFMYYEVKSFDDNGGVNCVPYHQTESFSEFSPDDLSLLAEEILLLPNVTDLLFIPKGGEQEIRYFYRGEGEHKDKIIEVSVSKDRKATIRYFRHLNPGQVRLPELGASLPSSKISLIELPHDGSLPDLRIMEQKSTMSLGGIKLKTESSAKLNRQTMNLALADETGSEWVKVGIRHQTLKEAKVITAVPIKFEVSKGLQIGGEATIEAQQKYRTEEKASTTKTLSLVLTDHNNEYLRTTLISKEGARDLIVSSRYNLGSFGSVAATKSVSSTGNTQGTITHEIRDLNSSTKTTYGMTPDARRYLELLREQQLSKTSSLAISLRTDDQKKTTILYQYRMELK